MVRVLFLFLLPLFALGAELPDADPRTVVQGREMVDAAIALVREKEPSLEIKSGIETFELHSIQQMKLARPYQYGNKLVAKALTPGYGWQTVELLGNLQAGNQLNLAGRVTGERLHGWILSQPNRSVLPHELLAQAIMINKGNTLLALADIWNTLTPNWEAAATRNVNPLALKLYDVTGEYNLRDGVGYFALTKKAFDPRAPLEEKLRFAVTKRGDVFSTYYHFFGAMLYSQYMSAITGSSLTGKLMGKVAVKLEGALFRKTSGLNLEREKRILNDIEGANAGARLQKLIKNPKKIAAPAPAGPGGLPAYLKPDPRVPADYLLESDGRAPIYFKSSLDEKFRRGAMPVEEMKLRFAYAVTYDNEVLNPWLLSTSSDGERLQTGLQLYVKNGANDPELNSWLQKYYSGWATKSRAHVDFATAPGTLLVHLEQNREVKFDPDEALRRIDRQVQLVMEIHNLKKLPIPADPPLPYQGKCAFAYEVLKEVVKGDLKRRRGQ